ncbi:hypothetical protein DL95DRAFT_478926 [Leptodontidium sp. 2 PMI_412]|nr:hypothetical protein DL95DRAFT_478926 [Leptodontidium sp. 2 PMI_412]
MPSQVALRTFALFPQLPFEIQDMIWKISLSEPRSISGEDCFREWWYGKIVRFSVPVALHVCHRSRSLAMSTLKRTAIQIPGVPGWRIFYLNQACDYFTVTKRDVQMNLKVSGVIANTTLVNRVVISWEVPNEASLKNMIQYFDHLHGLEEVALTDRRRLYLIHQRTFSRGSGCKASADKLSLVRRIQQFFRDENRLVSVSGCWFDRETNSGVSPAFSDGT